MSDGEVLLAGLLFFPSSVLKVGRTRTRTVVESSEGLEKKGSDKINTTIAKVDLVRSLLGDGEKQEPFDGHPRPDDGRDVLPTWRTPAIDARGPDQIQCMVWQAIGHCSSTPSSTRRAEQNTELRRHDRLREIKSIPGSPKWLQSWRLAVPPRGSSSTDTKTSPKSFEEQHVLLGLKDNCPYQCRHSGALLDKAGQHRTMLEIKKKKKR